MTAATNKVNDKTSRDKFITCAFLAGVDAKKYRRLKIELNDSYEAGHNSYTHMIESDMPKLSHYMNGTNIQPTNENEGQQVLTSFAQQRKHGTCYKCGKKGH